MGKIWFSLLVLTSLISSFAIAGNVDFYNACSSGDLSKAMELLLSQPDINVNKKDSFGYTPFLNACHYGKSTVVEVLLKDSRVNINEGNHGTTPFRYASYQGYFDVVQMMIASGREFTDSQRVWGTGDLAE